MNFSYFLLNCCFNLKHDFKCHIKTPPVATCSSFCWTFLYSRLDAKLFLSCCPVDGVTSSFSWTDHLPHWGSSCLISQLQWGSVCLIYASQPGGEEREAPVRRVKAHARGSGSFSWVTGLSINMFTSEVRRPHSSENLSSECELKFHTVDHFHQKWKWIFLHQVNTSCESLEVYEESG